MNAHLFFILFNRIYFVTRRIGKTRRTPRERFLVDLGPTRCLVTVLQEFDPAGVVYDLDSLNWFLKVVFQGEETGEVEAIYERGVLC